MSDEDAGKHRRSYGRGMFDGLRMAGIDNPEEFVNNAKLKSVESGLTGMAKKVLDSVPIAEAWTRQQISQELARKGSNPESRVVGGCLDSLVASGLVREPRPGNFVRAPEKPRIVEDESKEQAVAGKWMDRLKEVKQSNSADPMTELAELAGELRAMANAATKMATRIEDVALAAESRVQQINADSAKLKQLQELLRG